MSKGNPNDESRKLNFVPRVYDPAAEEDPTYGKYRPLYIAPEATASVLGDVYLSDSVSSTDNASTGVTAATPAAVKTAYDEAKKKLDLQTTELQTVKGSVTFSKDITVTGGINVPEGQVIKGDLQGNASTATQLQTARKITVLGTGSGANNATFNGTSDITLTVTSMDASKVNTGMLPLSVIPQGALDKLVKVANEEARYQLTTSSVQTGDSVLQTDTGVMYIVVDESKLNSAAGYQEYKASTALEAVTANSADKLTTPRNIRVNLASTSSASFDGSSDATPGVTGTLPIANGGTGITANPSMLVNLASTSADTVFEASPRPGITGTLAIAHGGTGATTASAALTNLGAAAANHTHAVFSTTANGFAPKSDGAANKFLCADGDWKVVESGVTGVKGDAETSYRTGNVNLTPANIGAAAANHTHNYLPLAGGTLTGTLTSRAISPSANNTYNIGTSSMKYANVYATNFVGNVTGNVTGSLSGNATTATTASRLNKTLTLSGDISGSVSLNSDGTSNMATEIEDKAVTNGKLADDVGTVYVGENEPTEAHIKLWVKI